MKLVLNICLTSGSELFPMSTSPLLPILALRTVCARVPTVWYRPTCRAHVPLCPNWRVHPQIREAGECSRLVTGAADGAGGAMQGFPHVLASPGPSSTLGEHLTPNFHSAAQWQASYAKPIPLDYLNMMFSDIILRERS